MQNEFQYELTIKLYCVTLIASMNSVSQLLLLLQLLKALVRGPNHQEKQQLLNSCCFSEKQ